MVLVRTCSTGWRWTGLLRRALWRLILKPRRLLLPWLERRFSLGKLSPVGSVPEVTRSWGVEAASDIRSAVEGAEAVFVLAGLGGGTGSGAAPYVAEIARESGALVIAVVTLPFTFEGKRRAAQAAESLVALQQHADAVICFENDRMGEAVPPKSGIQTAFAAADQTLSQCVQALDGLLSRTGLIHLGFDELVAVLRDVNARCLFGFGEAEGNNRSFDALSRALKNPLTDKGRMLRDCENVLVQVSGGSDLTLDEVQLLMDEFNRLVGERTRILFGAAVDPALEGRLTVTILSSIGESEPKTARVRPTASVSRPERTPVVIPTPQPQIVTPVQKAPEPAIVQPEPQEEEIYVPVSDRNEEAEAVKVEFAADEEPFELDEDQNVRVAEEPPVEPELVVPPAPLIEKPRGLRTATQQASLFGEEPAAPIERVAPPVPGRMLRRPFPERPTPALAVEPAAIPIAQPEPESVPEPALESITEPVVAKVVEAEPPPTPQPQPMVDRRPLPVRRPAPIAQPLRPPELIPADEYASGSGSKAAQQEIMEFEPITRGRFEKSEPTIVDGEDLDVPTYLRRRVKLR